MSLIDKLRNGALFLKKQYLVDAPLLLEAANEIERLEEKVAELKGKIK